MATSFELKDRPKHNCMMLKTNIYNQMADVIQY